MSSPFWRLGIDSVWRGMIRRCTDPKDPRFAHYGGRGITVCERWASSFENFSADMGPKPTPKHSLDRIDNDGNYEPGNCRWATRSEQARNSSQNKMVTYGGRTMPAIAWAQERGIDPYTLWGRLNRGWPAAEALGFERRHSGAEHRKVERSNRPLTEKQNRILNFIEGWVRTYGASPTIAEMARYMKVTNSAVLAHVRLLERKGRIGSVPGAARSLVVLNPPPLRPHPDNWASCEAGSP